MDLSLRVGELLLSSGAGAADVSAQMRNVAYACGLRRFSADVMFTELAMSHQPSLDEPALIQIRQVRHREIDYEDLTLVDHLVRDLIAGEIDRDEASLRLARIVSSGHARPRWAVTAGCGVMGAGVGLVLGGDLAVVIVATVAAVAIDLITRSMGAPAAGVLPADRRRPVRHAAHRGGGGDRRRRGAEPRDHGEHHHAARRRELHGRPPGRLDRLPAHSRGADPGGDHRDRRCHGRRQRRSERGPGGGGGPGPARSRRVRDLGDPDDGARWCDHRGGVRVLVVRPAPVTTADRRGRGPGDPRVRRGVGAQLRDRLGVRSRRARGRPGELLRGRPGAGAGAGRRRVRPSYRCCPGLSIYRGLSLLADGGAAGCSPS